MSFTHHMNYDTLYDEIIKQLDFELYEDFIEEYDNHACMRHDAKEEILDILAPLVERLGIALQDLRPIDLDVLCREEWINICAQYLANWNLTLENRVSDADDDRESHYELIALKELLFESAVITLYDNENLLQHIVNYIMDLSVMYERNCRHRDSILS